MIKLNQFGNINIVLTCLLRQKQRQIWRQREKEGKREREGGGGGGRVDEKYV